MHAVVYHGEGGQSWHEVPRPVIEAAADVVVRVDAVTICGTVPGTGLVDTSSPAAHTASNPRRHHATCTHPDPPFPGR